MLNSDVKKSVWININVDPSTQDDVIKEFFLWYFSANNLEEIIINNELERLNGSKSFINAKGIKVFTVDPDFVYDKEKIVIINFKTFMPYPQEPWGGDSPQIVYCSDYIWPKDITFKRPFSNNRYISRTISVNIGIYHQWLRNRKLENVLS